MANNEHVKLIKEGSKPWNEWRHENPEITPDLSGADLTEATLGEANLTNANLIRADLSGADLIEARLSQANLIGANLIRANLNFADLVDASLRDANLSRANLRRADLTAARLIGANLSTAFPAWAKLIDANFERANLSKADLSHADLSGADLRRADLSDADLFGADLFGTNFSRADLSRADISCAHMGHTVFADNDLSSAKGLESVRHYYPSTIGIDTLFKSDGKIPEVFLRGTGVPEDFITFVPSLTGQSIEFYSCFISFSHQDDEFSRSLHSRMRSESLRVWFAPEDMKGGKKLHEEIFRAIQIHDKLLLVLSDHSMKSQWVTTEIRRARKVERDENRRKLFPIRLVDFATIKNWECFDADSGKDLAVELREYYIPDFSNWKDHDAFEAEFSKLLRDLRATEK